MEHIPVMSEEALRYLDIEENGTYVDCTFGAGGHSLEIAKKLSLRGRLLSLDWDCETEQYFKKSFSSYKNAKYFCGNFADLANIIKKNGVKTINGILFDLGFSSLQIGDRSRGLSFNYDAPLDMRYSKDNTLTASQIVNTFEERKLSDILLDFADERFSKNIAAAICNRRKQEKISGVKDLVGIIESATPRWYHGRKIHCATKTFQALRIAVNSELENIKKGILAAINSTKCGGRIVVISFHSAEHRLLKKIFKEAFENNLIKFAEKKPVFPSNEEKKINPRSRSAQMRIVEKI